MRFQAGLILKTIVSSGVFNRLELPMRSYVVAQCTNQVVVGDPDHNVRKTVANVLANIFRRQDGSSQSPQDIWPQVIPTLASWLNQSNLALLDGSIHCLGLICEDCGAQLQARLDKPLDSIVPSLIRIAGHSEARLRRRALEALVSIIPLGSAAVDMNLQPLLAALSALTHDPDPTVRKCVCQALNELTEQRLEVIVETLQPILQFFLHATGDSDTSVALEACNFWSNFCINCSEATDALKEILDKLVPALMLRMVYSEDDLAGLPVDDVNDASVADRAEDLAPQFHSHRGGFQGEKNNGDDSDEDDGEGFEGGNMVMGAWTLRRSAATALDCLADTFENGILKPFLEALNQLLNWQGDEGWLRVESGILALGCIADGARQISGYLPRLFPVLLGHTKSPRPLLRKIAIWAMARYKSWILYMARQNGPDGLLNPLLQCFCERMRDHTKIVQNAAVSAVCRVVDEARETGSDQLLLPSAQLLLQTCTECLQSYQEGNINVLCDALSSIIDCCKSRQDIVRSPEFVQMVMPPLVRRWNLVKDDTDRRIMPLMEGLTSVAVALGPAFAPYAPPVLKRCISVIEVTLMVVHSGLPDELDYIDTDPMCVALDLLGALAEGLGTPAFQQLMNSSPGLSSGIGNLLFHCVEYDDPEVKQSSLGCLGEVAKVFVGFIAPLMPKLMPHILKTMQSFSVIYGDGEEFEGDDDISAACNNAIWCLGEIALKIGAAGIAQYVPAIMERLVSIVRQKSGGTQAGMRLPESVKTNAAITVGRLAMVCPAEAAALHMQQWIKEWCYIIRNMPNDAEKDHATRGLCAALMSRPQVAMGDKKALAFVCQAFLSWMEDNGEEMSKKYNANEVLEMTVKVIRAYQQNLGSNGWHALLSDWPAALSEKVTQVFG